MSSQVYEHLNKAWKSTCRVLLGEELGELSEYTDWLLEYVTPVRKEKSTISGKTVSLAIPNYAEGARFISFDEIEFDKKFEPLNINEIKDIDSIINAVQERIYYAGNIILGNSMFVESSSNVIDSNYVYNATTITKDSKYIGYCDSTRDAEYEFGCYSCGESSYLIKCVEGFGGKRCFESHSIHHVSDAYYCHSLQHCSEALFSFGALSKRHIVGNLELPKEKYYKIKQKILSEIAEIVKKEKRIFSLLEIIEKSRVYQEKIEVEKPEEAKFDKSKVENAFSSTTSLLFGRKLELNDCEPLLKRHVPQNIYLKSPISGRETIVGSFLARLFDRYDIKHKTVSEEEMRIIGRTTISPTKIRFLEEQKFEKYSQSRVGNSPVNKTDSTLADFAIEKLEMDVGSLSEVFGSVAFACFDGRLGNNPNTQKITLAADSESCYNGSAFISSKKCAYDYWVMESECIFGSSAIWDSAFCINCYWSKKLQRAFEVDSSKNCSDVYFLHNCENVHDSMFCFNARNLRYAIGNMSIEKEKYLEIKERLVKELIDNLEKNKQISIYNIGAYKRN